MFLHTPKSAMCSPCLEHFYTRYLVIHSHRTPVYSSRHPLPLTPGLQGTHGASLEKKDFWDIFGTCTAVSYEAHAWCLRRVVLKHLWGTNPSRWRFIPPPPPPLQRRLSNRRLSCFGGNGGSWGAGGSWSRDMEGKDMPAGQLCDVFATCRNMRVFHRRGG